MREFDEMKMKSFLRCIQPDRPRVTEEMHFMSAPRQFGPESGRQNSASADQWETGDANSKRLLIHSRQYTRRRNSSIVSRSTKVTPGPSALLM